ATCLRTNTSGSSATPAPPAMMSSNDMTSLQLPTRLVSTFKSSNIDIVMEYVADGFDNAHRSLARSTSPRSLVLGWLPRNDGAIIQPIRIDPSEAERVSNPA